MAKLASLFPSGEPGTPRSPQNEWASNFPSHRLLSVMVVTEDIHLTSQGTRFLCCIPAVRFGLRKRRIVPHETSGLVDDQPGQNQGITQADSVEQLPAQEDARVKTTPQPETVLSPVPQVEIPDETKRPGGERPAGAAQAAKVIVLQGARSALHRRRSLGGDAKGPAVIIPFPHRGRLPSNPLPVEPHGPQVVSAKRGLRSRTSSEVRTRKQELRTWFPRLWNAEAHAGMQRGSMSHWKKQKGVGGNAIAPQPLSRHKSKTGRQRPEAPARESGPKISPNHQQTLTDREITPRSPPT